MQDSVKDKIKLFIGETFRSHSKEEYAEVFSYASAEDKPRKYPWLYARTFLLLLVIFALSVLTYRLTRYSVAYITSILFGGLLFNIPVLMLFFEIFPKKNISLLTLFLLVLTGGAVTGAFILFGYEFIYEGHENPWISYLWTGFLEEFVKAAFAVGAIALLKKKDPLTCFLVGFAVGTGYSFFEDMGYVYMYSRGGGYGVSGYGWIVLMSVARGFSCVCSHAPWTGVICWAFAKFKKPFLNYRFYAVVLSSMLLHYLADVPFYAEEVAFLSGLNWGWAIEAFVVIAIIAEMFIMLKSSFKECNCAICTGEQPLNRSLRLARAANSTAVLCAVLCSICALVGCSLNIGYTAKQFKFESDESFINYVQSGCKINSDWERAYNAEQPDYSEFTVNGETISVTQEEVEGDYKYYYFYINTDEGYSLQSLGVKYLGKVYYCRRLMVYENYAVTLYGYPANIPPVSDDPVEPEPPEEPEEPVEPVEPPELLKTVSYYVINENAGGISYDIEEQSYTVSAIEEIFIGLGAAVALGSVFFLAFSGGLTAYIILKVKSRSKGNG